MNERVVLVGGGLANALIAYRLRERRPEVDLLLLERGPALGGNHVWSHHDDDLDESQRDWTAPFVERAWTAQEVRFPRRERVLACGYRAWTSARLHAAVARELGERVRYGVEVREVRPRGVRLADGSTIDADAVIDGRGDPGSGALSVAFQKFFGQTLELERPHGLMHPTLMDATVEQRDGFRFFYLLPFGEAIVHVEDTRYSDGPALDRDALRDAVGAYVRARGWRVRKTLGEEEGALPIVLGGDIDAFWNEGPAGVPRSGLRAGLFHPTTGYSLPEAVRLADDLATFDGPLTSETLHDRIRARSKRLWKRDGFFRLLNRMLFRAAEPEERYRVLERFYGLPEPLIRRFYAGRPTLLDRARVLSGKPPVPVSRALRCLADPGPSA